MHRFIPRKIHAILDYLFSALIIVSPWAFGFADQHVAPQLAVTVGSGILLYSLFTDYELGLIRALPFRGHLFLDLIAGVLLGASCIHFAMGGRAGVVFAIIGAGMIAATFLTERPKDTATT